MTKKILTIYSKDIKNPIAYELPDDANPAEQIQAFLNGRYVESNEGSQGFWINPQAITLITCSEAVNKPEDKPEEAQQPVEDDKKKPDSE